jgi:hypothetical protein
MKTINARRGREGRGGEVDETGRHCMHGID